MLRSLYSGISGMKVNQTKLDVIGNNIANVGTSAFKSQRARFSTALSQTITNASSPSMNAGGVNASQVGLGVQLASIDSVMTNGNLQSTGRLLDVAIDKTGYFVVSSGPVINGDAAIKVSHQAGNHSIDQGSLSTSGASLMYTRDGSFILDQQGNLLTTDGYRVMGYSLTNDDSTQEATSKNSNNVTAAGFTFVFGPGSQLNGYKVVLGKVAPGTSTEATVDKKSKQIILNGDFSNTSTITSKAVETAVALGLNSAGISQKVSVTGSLRGYEKESLVSGAVSGGTDANAPGAVTFGGYTLTLGEGSELEGYKMQIGNVTSSTLSATVNKDEKLILIEGDFLNGVSSNQIKELINRSLKTADIKQSVISVDGSFSNLSDAKTTLGSVVPAELPTIDGNNKDLLGYGFTVGAISYSNNGEKTGGADLNGYAIELGTAGAAGDPISVSINKSTKTILIKGFNGKTAADITTKVNEALDNNSFDLNITIGGTWTDTATTTSQVKINTDGVNYSNIPSTSIAGFVIDVQANTDKGAASDLDGYTFVLGKVNSDLSVDVYPTSKKITINGDFTSAGLIASDELAAAINDKLNAIGLTAKVDVSGSATSYLSLTSDEVTGGTSLQAPEPIEGLGLTFEFSDGAALNGYTVEMGVASKGTTLATTIDTTNKKIIINGDFVSGNLTSDDIRKSINNALTKKGFSQSVRGVSGNVTILSLAESTETNGGTPIQSLSEDGEVYFVDATATVNSYDGALKTLKIPEKIKVAGSDQELSVVTYTIEKTGIISAVLEDGSIAALGQIAMATFKNQEGLTRESGSLFTTSVNSGDPIIRSGTNTNGEDNSLGYGEMVQSYLEMSNVDLAEQFTEMITATRAFQASSKMISTGDEILQDIINLKR